MLSLGTVTVVNAAADNRCPDPPCSIGKGEDASILEEIVVTGSHIRGVEAVGSKLIVIGRDQIDASGYGRVEDVLATVTQNFNRANAAVSDSPDSSFFNLNHGAEVQLRGLGAVLRDAREWPASGSEWLPREFHGRIDHSYIGHRTHRDSARWHCRALRF